MPFPFVPVMPMSENARDGSPKKAQLREARAMRESATTTCVTPGGTSVGRCTTTAAAPRAIASDTNACPSCCRPGMATKSPPDRTALEW